MGKLGLHSAVLRGDAISVRDHLLCGADVDEPFWDGDGKTPLLLAASTGNVHLVKLLCEHGCNLSLRTVHGESALILGILSRRSVKEMVHYLLDSGCDPNIQENIHGNTALHCLTRHLITTADYSADQLDTLKYLIERCNPKIKDHMGRTALHKAVVANASIDCIQILLACDVEQQNIRGETALMEAIEYDSDKNIIALLTAISDLSVTTNYKETPVHIACRKGKDKLLKILLAYGAPTNSQDLQGNTPLHLAASRGYAKIVHILCSRSCSEVNIQNNDGLTPLHVAVDSGFLPVVQVLLRAESCDVNIRNSQSQTALDMAKEEHRLRSQPALTSLLCQLIEQKHD